ncbi:MAG: GNAT family acetyltransferase [Anaerolineae bacterium]|nr:GNAT family acetyltransferase [Anaerolineae bacterium]
MREQIPSLWRIRPFEMSDYEAVFDLWRHAGGGVTLRPSDSREEIAKKLTRDPELFLVAEIDGQVVGVIMGAWDGRRGWLHHLTVAEAFRNWGVATALVCQVEEALRARGCLKVNLLVRESNQAARQLYRHLGYAEMGEFLPMGKELQE